MAHSTSAMAGVRADTRAGSSRARRSHVFPLQCTATSVTPQRWKPPSRRAGAAPRPSARRATISCENRPLETDSDSIARRRMLQSYVTLRLARVAAGVGSVLDLGGTAHEAPRGLSDAVARLAGACCDRSAVVAVPPRPRRERTLPAPWNNLTAGGILPRLPPRPRGPGAR